MSVSSRAFFLDIPSVQRLTRFAPLLILAGVVLLGVQILFPLEFRFVAISSLMLVSLGIYAGALRNWSSETGLWMLASLGATVSGIVYVYTSVYGVAVTADSMALQIRWVCDTSVAMAIFWYQVRFCCTVVHLNWRHSKAVKLRIREAALERQQFARTSDRPDQELRA